MKIKDKFEKIVITKLINKGFHTEILKNLELNKYVIILKILTLTNYLWKYKNKTSKFNN